MVLLQVVSSRVYQSGAGINFKLIKFSPKCLGMNEILERTSDKIPSREKSNKIKKNISFVKRYVPHVMSIIEGV